MWKRVCLVILSTALGIGTATAQGLGDHFHLVEPNLTAVVIKELGTTPCTAGNWNSFICDPDAFNLSISAIGALGMGFDVNGAFYQIRVRDATAEEHDCPRGWEDRVFDIERQTGTVTEIIAQVPFTRVFCISEQGATECEFGSGACLVGSRIKQRTTVFNVAVDTNNGHVHLATASALEGEPFNYGIVRITGLTTLLDIIPTFQPASETLSWITPKHPEALPAADRFMVYAGDIRDLPDFSRAARVDCTVPDVGPSNAGDFLSILDPLPTPDPGQASYAIIGVEHERQRRFGRQNVGDVLSGRDPGAFRRCGGGRG